MQIIRQFRLDACDPLDKQLFDAFRATWAAMEPVRNLVPEHRYLNAWIVQLHQRAMFTDDLIEAIGAWADSARRHAQTRLQGDGNASRRAEIDAAVAAISRVVDLVAGGTHQSAAPAHASIPSAA